MSQADAQWVVAWMRAAAQVVGENREYLIDLDRVIGDADHGENLDRGFRAVVEKLDAGEFATPGDVFKVVAMTLMTTVGGAYGPLMGTAYLRAATTAGDATELDGPALAAVLEAALGGIVLRGKAEVGEKTMVDAWDPGVKAAKAAAQADGSAYDVMQAFVDAATVGRDSTKDLQAHKGRASYLGERSIGHLDPGSVSTVLIMEQGAATLKEN